MAKGYVALGLLAAAPLLQSCSSIPTTLVLYGAKALMGMTQSNESAHAYYQAGRFYQTQNRLDTAELAYQRALFVDPAYYEAHNALGVIYSMQSKWDLASEQFRAALAQAPRAAHLHGNLGHAYYLQNKFTEAINSLETAAALDPHNPRTLQNLSLAYERAGFPEKAQLALRKGQTSRAGDALAVANVLGEPGITARQLSAAPAITPAPARSVTPAGEVYTRALPTPPSTSIPVAPLAVKAATRAPDVIAQRSDTDLALVMLTPHVYELRAPKLPAPQPAAAMPTQQAASTLLDRLFRLEVANGNAIPGMAGKVASQLKRTGFQVVRLTNQIPYKQTVTEIQYREGYATEAHKLASSLQKDTVIVRDNALRPDIHVRLVLGKDTTDHVALMKLEPLNDRTPLTLAAKLP